MYSIGFLLCFIVNFASPYEIILSGTIKEDITFHYRSMTKYPATKVEMHMHFKNISNSHVKLDFFTSENKFLPVKNCSFKRRRQLINDDMGVPLKFGNYRFSSCSPMRRDVLECVGNTTFQDYKPMHFGFTLGYKCYETYKISLRGISYTLRLKLSNSSDCIDLEKTVKYCPQYYSQTTFSSLVGVNNPKQLIDKFDYMTTQMLPETTPPLTLNCYQHFFETLCYTLAPKCVDNQMITACKETCDDFFNGCFSVIKTMSRWMAIFNEDHVEGNKKLFQNKTRVGEVFNCDYLPSVNGSIPCFYKPVMCVSPEGTMKYPNSLNRTFTLGSRIKYNCGDGQKDGNDTITCLHSGKWSEPSTCSNIQNIDEGLNLLYILLPSLGSVFVITVLFFICLRKRKKDNLPTRQKEFDAFVCYAYEKEDMLFAEKIVRQELEENCDPPFKLCIHRRDFLAAWDIMWNIRNAIRKSNSAIVIMSQNYVNSLWCKEEFEQCYMEHMKDPAFKVFVIMLQPRNQLRKTSEYMDSYFASKTYLEKDDSKIFRKISNYLKIVKEPKVTNIDNINNEHGKEGIIKNNEVDNEHNHIEMEDLL